MMYVLRKLMKIKVKSILIYKLIIRLPARIYINWLIIK